MTSSVNSGALLDVGMGKLALAVCMLVTLALLLPFSLSSIGVSAILAVAGGLDAPRTQPASNQSAVRATGTAALFAPPAPIVTTTDLPYAAALVPQARSWIGTRYVFGGCSASGIDCSCFVQTIFRSAGIALPRTSQQQYIATIGRGLGVSTPEPGDLVFFFHTYFDATQDWTHVGIVSRVDSNGTVWMINAPGARAAGDPPDAPFGRVREEPIAGSWLQHRATYARISVS